MYADHHAENLAALACVERRHREYEVCVGLSAVVYFDLIDMAARESVTVACQGQRYSDNTPSSSET